MFSDPCQKYGFCGDDSFFGHYRYLPPSLILSVILLLSAAVIAIWLNEPSKSQTSSAAEIVGFELLNPNQSDDTKDEPNEMGLEEAEVGVPMETELEALHANQQTERIVSPGVLSAATKDSACKPVGSLGLADVMRNPCAVLSIVGYSWCSMINMMLAEVWALWCVTSTSYGGLVSHSLVCYSDNSKPRVERLFLK